MARIRTIKPDFFTDRTVGRLGPAAAVVYVALWCWADDTGAAKCDPDRLKAECFAFWPDLTEDSVRTQLQLLEDSGRISRYKVGEDGYCLITNFLRHQKINRPSATRFPRPSVRAHGGLTGGKGKGKGNGKGVGNGEPTPAPDGAAPPTNWPADIARALSIVGPVAPGRIGKQLAPFVRDNPHVQAHGVAVLVQAAESYARHVTSLPPEKVGFVKHPADFFSRAGYWVDQVRPGGLAEEAR